ncbi:MAG: T9SS type A sorting domain-containing protein, partial [Saprospiraceae bacterium]|nr:T9SS type A sorting domain-containing protein [Saprospiraceae bacterium]
IGDVNNSVVSNSSMISDDRTSGSLLLDVNDRDLKAGEIVEVTFSPAENIEGYQTTLNLNGLKTLGVVANDRVTANNFGIFENAVTVSIDEHAAFTLRFEAQKAGKLSEMIAVSNSITKSQAYKSSGASVANWEVALRFNGQNGSVIAGAGYELLQNVPNPVNGLTTITFHLPEAASAEIMVSNAEGKLLKTISGDFAKGLNTVTMQRAELETGILFYQLNSGNFTATKKMIVVD